MLILLPFLIAFAGPAGAATCKDLKSCAKAMYEITGQRYLWEAESEKKIETAPEIELTKLNAEVVFTAMLDQVGLARAPVGDGKTYRIVRSAYRKEMELPSVDASAELMPAFPDTWDWMTMRYRTRARELTSLIEQNYRLHVPREARMQADFNGGFILVSGPAPMVRNMYGVIKAADVPITTEVRKRMEEEEKRRERRQDMARQGMPPPGKGK